MLKIFSLIALIGLAWLNLMLHDFAEPLYYFLVFIPSLVGALVLGQVWLPNQSQAISHNRGEEN